MKLLPEKEYYQGLPKKRVTSAAILTYGSELLIVKPTYRPYWLLPGGSNEADESPLVACLREIREETGIEMPTLRFSGVDYVHDDGVRGEALHFLFRGELVAEQARNIVIPPDEIEEYRFLGLEDALPLLFPNLARRVNEAWRSAGLYFEQGSVREP